MVGLLKTDQPGSKNPARRESAQQPTQSTHPNPSTPPREAWEFGDLLTTTLRFPTWVYYACVPVGAGPMTLRYLILLGLMATGSGAPERKP